MTSPPESGCPPSWRRWLTAGVAAIAVSGVVTAVVLVANHDQETGTPAASPATTSTTPPPSPIAPSSTTTSTTTSTTSAHGPTTSNPPTATTNLARFFAAADKLDRQLRAAAAAINGTGPPWKTVSEPVARAVRAADLAPAATTIPAGLPRALLRSVVLVYSDLASRRYAMADFSVATSLEPGTNPSSDDLLRALGNGHAAAVRFAGDLAATRALAGSTPAVTTPPASSRAAAEVLLYARYVEGANGGCGSRGGEVMTELPAILWDGRPGDGTIGTAPFTAGTAPDGTWRIRLNAC
ncbi:hypothetical protein [Actinophytocola sp. KF-1]